MEGLTGTAAPPRATAALGLEAVLSGAVDFARTAVAEYGGNTVGDYLGMTVEDQHSATHRFLAQLPGYSGWQWAVVVAAYPGSDHPTISEVVLLPGPTALLAPAWVPWTDRVQPGDLGPGDVLAPPCHDPRLVPGHQATGDPQVDETALDIGLGRRQVLGAWGRAEVAARWHEGDFGPQSAMARATRRVCGTCGFYLPLAGALGAMFGACANEMSADGRVVAAQYGCGAHSDTPVSSCAPRDEPFDDGVLEISDEADRSPR